MHDSVSSSMYLLSSVHLFSSVNLMLITLIKPPIFLEPILRDSDSAQLEGACTYLLYAPEVILMQIVDADNILRNSGIIV